jgi:hypothetical protein
MKATELRIGSTYQSVKFNQPVKLTAEDICELVKRAEGADIDDYIDEMFQPIPLVEEKLIELGFKHKEGNLWKLDKFYLFYKDGVVFNIAKKSGRKLEKSTIKVYIKYEHQLENIYYDVMNTKLL